MEVIPKYPGPKSPNPDTCKWKRFTNRRSRAGDTTVMIPFQWETRNNWNSRFLRELLERAATRRRP